MELSIIKTHEKSKGIPRWNITANVGLKSPNKTDDVHLVQFGYYIMANNPVIDPQRRQIFAGVKVGVPCNGTPNDPLVQCIMNHQKARRGLQDGHVSVIKSGLNRVDHNEFLLMVLNWNMSEVMRDYFPRIDKHPKCPPIVAEFVRLTCTNDMF